MWCAQEGARGRWRKPHASFHARVARCVPVVVVPTNDVACTGTFHTPQRGTVYLINSAKRRSRV